LQGFDDVIVTLDLALAASELDQVQVRDRPRLLSDSSSSYIAGNLADWLEDKRDAAHLRSTPPPADPRQ
jgi:putative transposase